jgi:hypothetical protein
MEHCEVCGDILDNTTLANGWTVCECSTCETSFSIDDQGYRVEE